MPESVKLFVPPIDESEPSVILPDAVATASGNITLGSDSSIGGTNNFTLSGIISDGVNTYALTKVNAGITTLTGANTYDGTTTILGGTLAKVPPRMVVVPS